MCRPTLRTAKSFPGAPKKNEPVPAIVNTHINASWLNDPTVGRLFAALGHPGVDVRFVGGCVRDALLGRSIGDIDIATPDPPSVVMQRLEQAKIKAVPTGLAHGTLTAVVDGRGFEITTLRRDTSCDGRHAAVEFTTDWQEDARRRDFTINAMSLTLAGELFDNFGGQADAKAGRIQFVGAARDRIKEDYLRVLRLFRFHAHYGRVPIDAETLQACANLKDGLTQLSAERIRQELAKLLAAPDPLVSLAMMRECGVLNVVLPEVNAPECLAQVIIIEKSLGLPPNWILRLAAFSRPHANAHDIGTRLRLSNRESGELVALLADQPDLAAAMPDSQIDLVLYRSGKEPILNRAILKAAGSGAWAAWEDVLRRALNWVHLPMPIDGDDLLKLGLAGPSIGRALRAAEEAWAASAFRASRAELLEVAKP